MDEFQGYLETLIDIVKQESAFASQRGDQKKARRLIADLRCYHHVLQTYRELRVIDNDHRAQDALEAAEAVEKSKAAKVLS